MFEAILQNGEQVIKHDTGVYCGAGSVAAIKEGTFVLTDRRIIILKGGASNMFATTIGVVLAVGITVGLPTFFNVRLGMIEAALIGGATGGLFAFLANKLFKKKPKPAQAENIIASINFEDIGNVEVASRGVNRDMIGLVQKTGDMYKITGMKDKDEWRTAITNNINKA